MTVQEKKLEMNKVEYKLFCEDFFKKENINYMEKISSYMKDNSVLILNNLIFQIELDYHNEKFIVIKNLVAKIRGSFDCLKDDSNNESYS